MEAFKAYAEANDWTLLVPEIFLACGSLLLLIREAFRKEGQRPSDWLAYSMQGGIFLYLILNYLSFDPNPSTTTFNGLLHQGYRGDVMRCFFSACALLTSLFATPCLRRLRLPTTEFHAITSLAAAGMMLLVQSNHFLMMFVSLEMVAVCFYVLVGYHRGSAYSLEAGLKYLVFGAMSSAILLFGITLLYGAAGNLSSMEDPALSLASAPDLLGFSWLESVSVAHPEHPLLLAGVAFLLAGLAFKLGAAPFQAWVPDVYQGAPTAVSAYLAVASKAAGFIVLYNLVTGPLAGMRDFLIPALSMVAGLTILMGNLGALTQRNVKRLMGLSGVAHAGYLLVGIVAAMHPDVPEHRVFWAIAFYLLTYLLASFGVFGVMSLIPSDDDADQPLSSYSSLAQKQPFLAFVLATSLGSLAGIPPLAGFIGKLLLFVVVFQAGLHGLFGVMVVGVVISIYYYFAWIRQAIFPPLQAFDEIEEQRRSKLSAIVISFPVTLVLMILVIGIIGLGIYQGSIGENF